MIVPLFEETTEAIKAYVTSNTRDWIYLNAGAFRASKET
jgi:hypothetical protein